jgi:regulator of RNase E activity RraB
VTESAGAAFLRTAPAGTRVVVRHLLDDGMATDALGYLHVADGTHCVVSTKRGLETIALGAVILAKEVPPPPAPRPR